MGHGSDYATLLGRLSANRKSYVGQVGALIGITNDGSRKGCLFAMPLGYSGASPYAHSAFSTSLFDPCASETTSPELSACL
jgi:hypothetical protein